MEEPVRLPGIHTYDTAVPLAVIVTGLPGQVVVELAEVLTVGRGSTVTVTVEVEVQPVEEFVPLTVYVVVEEGDTVMVADVWLLFSQM
jgi:hypothetical protein